MCYLVMLPGILATMAEAGGGDTERTVATMDEAGEDGPGIEWTFMVYISTDNDLDRTLGMVPQGRALLDELENAIFVPGVKVIALIDVYNNWDDAPNHNVRLYRIWEGDRELLADWGERNTGDPTLLSDFVIWTINNHGGIKYALTLFDHGDAYKRCCLDEHSSSDSLTAIEIQTALTTVQSQTTETMDLLGFDTCLTQYSEVAYQLRSYGTVMVGSEEVEKGLPNEQGGWPYDAIITDLCNNKFMDAITLGTIIVDDYEAEWETSEIFKRGTLSALYLPNMETMAQRLDNFAQNMRPLLNTHWHKIKESRNLVERFRYPQYIDLYHFAYLIEQNSAIPKPPALTTAIDQLQFMLDYGPGSGGLMINSWSDYREHPNAHGLGICLGYSPGEYDDSGYEPLALANNYYGWKEFARNYVMLRWEARTYNLANGYQDPTPQYMHIGQVTMNKGIGYSVDTYLSGSSAYGFAFMGVLESRTFKAKADGTISLKGWFLLNDNFVPEERPYRSYVAAFAILPGGQVFGVSTYIIRWDDSDYAKDVWLYRSRTISGLTPYEDYYIGIGRLDQWTYEKNLYAKWEGVNIIGYQVDSSFSDFTVNLNTKYFTYDYANLYRMESSENIWHVDSYGWDGTPAAAYGFMGLSDKTYTVKSDGTIRIQGYFRLHDTFSVSLRPTRSYAAVYVIDPSVGYMYGYSYAIRWDDADYAQHKWLYRDFTISGLTPYKVVKMGVGRGDGWATDWQLTTEWKNLVVTGG
jgi:hypothetical protein